MIKKDKLETKEYPQAYQDYLEIEKDKVIDFVKGANHLLDAGCGSGRIIPHIAALVKNYLGVDNNDEYLKEAQKFAKKHSNVVIKKGDIAKLSSIFIKGEFDKSICLWNTIGCVKDDRRSIEEIARVTKNEIFFTVLAKGNLEKRKEYYEKLKIHYAVKEPEETILSKEWGASRAYSMEEVHELVKYTGFKIKKIESINDFAYAVYLESNFSNSLR